MFLQKGAGSRWPELQIGPAEGRRGGDARIRTQAVPVRTTAPADAVVLAVDYDHYRAAGWRLINRLLKGGRGLVMDVKGTLDPRERPQQIELWRL
jgi:hypothetical protein